MMKDDHINFHQAIQSFDSQTWIDAMNKEYKSMQDNDVWDLAPLPEGEKPIGYKWIFKTKRDSKGDAKRYKVCLVLRVLLKRKTLILKRLSL